MRLDGKFHKSDQQINIQFAAPQERFTLGYEEVQQVTIGREFEDYTGSYDVVPRAEAQTLETKEKFMTDDVRIKAIPIFEVSNNSGGNTIYIGTLDD